MGNVNKTIVVVIDTTRIRREIRNHYSPVHQDATNLGLSVEDILHLLSCLAQYSDDCEAIDIMAQDIADGLELECHHDYNAVISLLIESSRFLRKDLGLVARQHPGLQPCLESIKGNSAYFLME